MRRHLVLAAFVSALLGVLPSSAFAGPTAEASATCSDYSHQADAQRAADTIDADDDGVYCEALPCPCLRPGSSPPPSSPTPAPRRRAQLIEVRVTKVVDGDTIKTIRGSRRYTVRIIGIDTPETVRPGVSVECGGAQSSASMKQLAPVGSRVLLKTDPSQSTRDRFGRLLAYVQRRGADLGRAQIGRGHAKVYVFGGKPFSQLAAHRRSQASARAAGRGVWTTCNGDFHKEF